MILSVSSFLITLFISFILIMSLNYLIKNTNKIKLFRTDFFTVLILIIVLRLLLPIELSFTKSIYISSVMNPIMNFLNFNVIYNLSVLKIFIFVWVFGSFIFFFRFLNDLLVTRKMLKRIEKNAKCLNINSFFNDENKKNYTIMLSNFVNSPMICGFRKIIFLPKIEFSKTDLLNIIQHESQHIQNKDIYIKLFVNILVIIYWWFPPIYILRKNIDLFLEVRVDDQVTKSMSSQSRIDYAESLINVQRELKRQKEVPFSSILFINDSAQVLSYRIHYLLDGDFIKRTKSIFLALLCVLPFLSNMIILEPAYEDSNLVKDTMTIHDVSKGYIVQHKDGSYSLIINGEKAYLGNSIPKDFANLPIIKEKE